jgi:hypothetical protein
MDENSKIIKNSYPTPQVDYESHPDEPTKIIILPNFVEPYDLEILKNYVFDNEDKFPHIKKYMEDACVVWDEVIHSKNQELIYNRAVSMINIEDKEALAKNYQKYLDSDTGDRPRDYRSEDDSIIQIIKKYMLKLESNVQSSYGVWITPEQVHPPFTLMKAGDRLYDHCDGPWRTISLHGPSDYTASIYLNDEYEGGEFTMRYQGVSFKPKPGSAIIYNNNWHEDNIHGVEPVTSGKRLSITTWMAKL